MTKPAGPSNRNLHDGAQQHLVALAVQLKLARTLMEKDPSRAEEVLDGLSTQVDETLQELRDLAHGIYPPLLADKGLPDALASAARRAVLPVHVDASGLGRYAPEAEATVYFCVLEALQNAGKYAGEGANVQVRVAEDAHASRSGRRQRCRVRPPIGDMGAGSPTCSTAPVRWAAARVGVRLLARAPRSSDSCPPPSRV